MKRVSDRMRKHAKESRHAPTISEQRLWTWLRNRTFDGCKFRRQVPIGRYVVDFYCARLKLVVEIDGAHHPIDWTAKYDDERTAFLQKRGIEVVRIANELIAKDHATAEDVLRDAIRRRLFR